MGSLLVVSPATAVPSGFITRQGTELLLNGNPYRFSGLNIFNVNSDGYCGAQMDQGTRLDDALTSIGPGVKAIRSWFFQPLAINKGTGLRDWSAFDHTLQVANAHGKKVIATLTDQWGECGSNVAGNGYKDADWYVNGYQQVQPGMLVSYRDWVAEMVTRYKDDPTDRVLAVDQRGRSDSLSRRRSSAVPEAARLGRGCLRAGQVDRPEPPRQPGNDREWAMRGGWTAVSGSPRDPHDRPLRVPRLRSSERWRARRRVQRAPGPDQPVQRVEQAPLRG